MAYKGSIPFDRGRDTCVVEQDAKTKSSQPSQG